MMFCLMGCTKENVSIENTSPTQTETVTEVTEAASMSAKDMTVEEGKNVIRDLLATMQAEGDL